VEVREETGCERKRWREGQYEVRFIFLDAASPTTRLYPA
jgi:hypothetical protein